MGKIRTFSRHAFGPRTIFPIIASCLSGYISLVDRQMTIDDPMFWLLLVGGVGAGLISWVAIALDSWRKENEAQRLQATLDDLVAQISKGVAANPIPTHLQNLSNLSNNQIRAAVASLANRLREFEAMTKNAHRVSLSVSYPSGSSKDERDAILAHRRSQHHSDMDSFHAQFNNDYRPEALALRAEMRRRLGCAATPANGHSDTALDLGILAGVHPVNDSAINLEALARALPS
jgi:hypothetical protein